MKISILLPYKENFSPNYPGAVSIFLKDTINLSKYNRKIKIYGNTKFKKKLLKNYVNLTFNKFFALSINKSYLDKFIEKEKEKSSNLIEIHNRPDYINEINKINNNLVLYFHNNPNDMKGSRLLSEKINLIYKTKKIIFNSNWTKKEFLKGLKNKNLYNNHFEVINQSTNKPKVNFNKKSKLIIFVGRLNTSKGYDIFGKAIIKILNKYKDWKSVVIGDEPREKLEFSHKNLKKLGFLNHNKVSEWFLKSSIAVACSKWNEPFGRTALEASSRGCAVIISNRGGLSEAAPHALKIKSLTVNSLYKSIELLILNDKLRISYQKKSHKRFFLTNKFIAKKIDLYREKIIKF